MIDVSTSFYTVLGFSIFFAILGYYVGERGFQGVQNDLNNVKLDVANIKGKIDGPVTTVAVPTAGTAFTTPVSGSFTTVTAA